MRFSIKTGLASAVPAMASTFLMIVMGVHQELAFAWFVGVLAGIVMYEVWPVAAKKLAARKGGRK